MKVCEEVADETRIVTSIAADRSSETGKRDKRPLRPEEPQQAPVARDACLEPAGSPGRKIVVARSEKSYRQTVNRQELAAKDPCLEPASDWKKRIVGKRRERSCKQNGKRQEPAAEAPCCRNRQPRPPAAGSSFLPFGLQLLSLRLPRGLFSSQNLCPALAGAMNKCLDAARGAADPAAGALCPTSRAREDEGEQEKD